MNLTQKSYITDKELVFPKECVEFICDQFEKGTPIQEIADKIRAKISQVKSVIRKLQESGRLGIRKKGGYYKQIEWDVPCNSKMDVKEITMSRKKAPVKKEKSQKELAAKESEKSVDLKSEEPSLSDMLSDLSDMDSERSDISTNHKEMLIEILHKLIC